MFLPNSKHQREKYEKMICGVCHSNDLRYFNIHRDQLNYTIEHSKKVSL